ncbi:hypothetical protein Lal_00028940 [Lupinus albus]|nr:hypothetical protein Lal_00028940 [Lupinus albus]
MNKSKGSAISDAMHSISITTKVDELPPDFSPSTQPQPFIPLLAPFTYNSLPKLSGLCSLNFSASQDIMTITATD